MESDKGPKDGLKQIVLQELADLGLEDLVVKTIRETVTGIVRSTLTGLAGGTGSCGPVCAETPPLEEPTPEITGSPGPAIYIYGVAEGRGNARLGPVGIGQAEVYTISHGGLLAAWRPGKFYVERGKLLWRAGKKERPEFSLWPPDLLDCKLLRKDTGTGLNNMPVLQIHCLARHDPETVLFSGPEEVLSFWLDTLQSLQGDELELCPACGAPGSGRRLLDAGCGRCGWLSVRKRRLQGKKQ